MSEITMWSVCSPREKIETYNKNRLPREVVVAQSLEEMDSALSDSPVVQFSALAPVIYLLCLKN